MRTRRVVSGLACLGAALLIGVAILVYAWRQPTLAVVCFLVIGGLIAVAAGGRDWARLTLVILTVASLVVNAMLGFLGFQLQYGGIISIATAVQIVLEIAGCGLLLTKARTRSSDD